MSVKVGVRVRPFNQREKDLNCNLCVDMMGATTRIFAPDDPQKFRDFTFDYSFWSHDGFTPDQKGYFVPDTDKYADQRHVYQQVGQEILTNAWEGYHCCLFAYGQTGAGKSYSMVGYGANKGIVPITCSEIFQRTGANDDANKQYEVQVSMLEIYNQRVQDLLIPMNKRSKQGFKIRQSKTLGIYVEGLSKHYVDTYQAIQQKMQEGGKNRSIAATQMNASSSRAHTIISIEFRQRQVIQGKKREKLSVIHLVDLAGSEKVGKTGATGDRLKQAAGINKSLSALGLVIQRLAEVSMGKSKIVIPYRDSCLTRILQNALGGNSKTLMICAISPASDNYEETLSTLRYADQAKKIKNKAVVNESETDKLIRNLTAEKDELRQKVAKFEEMFKKLSLGLGVDPASLEEMKDAQEQLKFNTMMVQNYSMTKEEKKENEKKWNDEFAANKIDQSKPHLSNLNQDPMLSQKIKYALDQETIKIGKRKNQPKNDVEIGGMGIRPLHANISKRDDKYFIESEVCSEENEDTGVYLNGQNVTEARELMNYDRITFGTNNMFLIILPDQPIRNDIDPLSIDWDYAQNQLYLRKQSVEREMLEERERKMKEENDQILKQKQAQLDQLQKKLEKNLQQQKELVKAESQRKAQAQEADRLRKEIQKDKKKIQDRETLQKERIREKYYFEKKLLKTLPKCIQLNLIAKQFKRNISMSVKMLLPDEKDEEGEDDMDLRKRSIKIKVVNREVGYCYWWDIDKLSNRYYIIKDMSENYFETGNIPELSEKDDPFWDPPSHILIGRAFLTTKALSYMFDNETTLSIIGDDDHCGQLTVNMVPTDETGQRNLSEEMQDDEIQFQPEQLINQTFYYNVVIADAKISDNLQNIYVEYSVKVDDTTSEVFKTQEVCEKTQNPVFNYKKLHKFEKVTDVILQYLQTAKIIFKIYAYELVPKEKKEAIKKEEIQKKTPATPPVLTTPPVQAKKTMHTTQTRPAIETGKIDRGAIITHNQDRKSAQPLAPPKKKSRKDKEDCSIF